MEGSNDRISPHWRLPSLANRQWTKGKIGGQMHGLGALTQTDYHRTSFTIFIPGTANILQMFMTGISMVYGIPGEEMWNS
jgi:hypothetical protein